MFAHYQCLENDMSYICDSMRYLETFLGGIYHKRDWSVPVPSAHARPLPTTGPPFPARAPTAPPQPSTAEDSESDEG